MHGNLTERNFDELIGMFAQAPIGLCCFDRTLQFVFVNDYLAAINGISVEEHLGRSIHEVIPDIAAGVEGQLRQVFDTGEPIIGGAVDAETPAQPGFIRSFQHHYYAIKSEAGTVLRVACVVQEVTARKQAEEALDRARGELERRVEERTAEWREANAALHRESAERKRTQDLYKTLLHAAPDPIVTVDRDGEIVMVNRQVERVFGYGSEELIGQSVETLLPEHLRGRHVRHRNDYLGNPQVRPMGAGLELVARCKDGRELAVEISLSPVQTTEGALVTTVIRDITERKRAEDALRESEVRLRSFINNIPNTIYLKDTEGRYVLVNDSAMKQYGLPKNRLIGKTVFDLHPKGEADATVKQDREVLKQGAPIEAERELTYPDGSKHTIIAVKFPIRGESGEIIGIGGINIDITERKRAEQELRESEERYRELFDESPVAIWVEDWSPIKQMLDDLARGGIKDWRGYFNSHRDQLKTAYDLAKILDVSHATIELYRKESKEHMLRMTTAAVVIDEELDAFREMVLSFLAGQMSVDIESKDTAGDGSEIIVRRRMVIPPKYRDDWSRVIYAIEDITERKQTEESLRGLSARLITTQEEERSRIARELHDDFNQRLAILAMDIERLAGQQPAARKDLSDGLESLLRRTKELSSDVHRLSHQLHPSVLQHLGLVVATKSFCEELSNQNGIHIELVHHGVPRSLPGDVALCFYRIVQEALRNVIKHSGAESARVELGGTAEELTLQISDDGTGFDPESAQTRQGLGLLSMRERLRLVGGTISFERVEPAGTRIEVRVPITDSDQQ